ncbi:VRR-NUC domain-containing protein [Bradyrhizobium sp. 131]|uniref:VRR-NUC domain-containing protein n=1 Tax=Bradyrhizobium sp. 131 TaxID=2782609 RepID=UPI001FFFFF0D|nr:VRR-NUC domain-containing protein [Bradyrhizobium sp. 131]UPK16794.1 VRR-NUC domain-containing protein [Bradyrhizobium sp. 131]
METRIVDTIPEWRYQAEVIARLHALEDAGLPIACAGDMNRAKRSRRERMEAKVTGLTAGEPDVRVYVTGGFLLSIELKAPKGSRSKDQKDRHKKLTDLGFTVITAKAPTPGELADEVERIVRSYL